MIDRNIAFTVTLKRVRNFVKFSVLKLFNLKLDKRSYGSSIFILNFNTSNYIS